MAILILWTILYVHVVSNTTSWSPLVHVLEVEPVLISSSIHGSCGWGSLATDIWHDCLPKTLLFCCTLKGTQVAHKRIEVSYTVHVAVFHIQTFYMYIYLEITVNMRNKGAHILIVHLICENSCSLFFSFCASSAVSGECECTLYSSRTRDHQAFLANVTSVAQLKGVAYAHESHPHVFASMYLCGQCAHCMHSWHVHTEVGVNRKCAIGVWKSKKTHWVSSILHFLNMCKLMGCSLTNLAHTWCNAPLVYINLCSNSPMNGLA